jgi:hypothetical protein
MIWSDIQPYIGPNGEGLLHVNDRAEIDGVVTSANENPVLFLGYIARACIRAYGQGMVDGFRELFKKQTSSTRLGFGRFSRRPNDAKLIRQSHDNLIGIAWCGVILGHREPIKEIVKWVKWRLWNYCLTGPFDYRCQLQGSHTFVMKLAAEVKPTWIETIWFSLAAVVRDHSSDAYMKSFMMTDIFWSSQHLLSDRKRRLASWGVVLLEKRRESPIRWYRGYFKDDQNHIAIRAEEIASKW